MLYALFARFLPHIDNSGTMKLFWNVLRLVLVSPDFVGDRWAELIAQVPRWAKAGYRVGEKVLCCRKDLDSETL